MSVRLCEPGLEVEIPTSFNRQEITQGYEAVPDPAPSLERRFANCELLEISNHCTDIASYMEYTIVPKGVHILKMGVLICANRFRKSPTLALGEAPGACLYLPFSISVYSAFDGLGAYHSPEKFARTSALSSLSKTYEININSSLISFPIHSRRSCNNDTSTTLTFVALEHEIY